MSRKAKILVLLALLTSLGILSLFIGPFSIIGFDAITLEDFSKSNEVFENGFIWQETDACKIEAWVTGHKYPGDTSLQRVNEIRNIAGQWGFSRICDNKKVKSEYRHSSAQRQAGITELKGGKLYLTALMSPESFWVTENLKSYDIEVKATRDAIITIFDETGKELEIRYDSSNVNLPVTQKDGFNSFTFRIDFENEDKYTSFFNGAELESQIFPGNIINLRIKDDTPNFNRGGGEIIVDDIKIKPYFNCEIKNNEVIVSDRFVGETTFSITDLTYINSSNIKFCYDSLPPLKRDLTKQALKPDITLNTLTKLSQGKSISVGENQVIDIRYITDYKEDMTERCGADSGWVPQLNKCEKFVFEEEVIDVFYNIHNFIDVGQQSVTFEDNVEIFDTSLSISSPSYICGDEKKKASAGSPRDECWTSTITYGSATFPVIYNQEVILNQYMKIKYIPSSFFNGEEYKDTKNTALLTIINNGFLTSKTIQQVKDTALLNEKKQIKFVLENKLGNIDDSGIKFTKLKKIINTIEEKDELIIPFKSGTHEYEIDADTTQIGEVIDLINFYYIINEKMFFDDESLIINYFVEAVKSDKNKTLVTNLSVLPPGIVVPPDIVVPRPIFITQVVNKNDLVLKIGLAVLIFLLLGGIGYAILKR